MRHFNDCAMVFECSATAFTNLRRFNVHLLRRSCYPEVSHYDGGDNQPEQDSLQQSILCIMLGRLFSAILFAGIACAQWVNYPTPGIPRTRDGKPNLKAPAPRAADGKPDISGLWQTTDGKYLNNLAADGIEVPFKPWAETLFKQRQESNGKGRPSERCISHGVTDFDALPTPTKIVQTPSLPIVLFEAYNHYRQIFTDGRALPKETQPSWLGNSVGRWDDDTFVVETTGLNDQTWLDDGGHPHTEDLHVTERFRRRDFGHLDIQVTIDDPKAYNKPWTVTIPKQLLADTELIEWMCENEKDYIHLVGK
jgi:hypothetical protein